MGSDLRHPSEPTFDQELLLWLGDEPPPVRAADAERVREIAAEFALGFDRLAAIGPAVAVFGSARTPPEHPHYELIRATTSVFCPREIEERHGYAPALRSRDWPHAKSYPPLRRARTHPRRRLHASWNPELRCR